ncbi:hypothetical protein PHYPSEUDO_003500 [Phytophthora pseudosyringae]|uniref:Uncharacterized protein n=1 Tax=Phytophthora pseudosyringae TaxID=221518 RepID=A0A8T1VQI5_9STRA|nr:hypothetical protein PHYPSEUDO_003500 [Phytophthora pseudosyringae]
MPCIWTTILRLFSSRAGVLRITPPQAQFKLRHGRQTAPATFALTPLQAKAGRDQQDGLVVVNSDQASNRQTPYQRMRERIATRSTHDATQAITTVDDPHAHIRSESRSDPVVIRQKLLWLSSHQHKQLESFI